MAIVKGGLLSISKQKGRIGNVTYGTVKGRTFARKQRETEPPPSMSQLQFRALFQALCQKWRLMDFDAKDYYNDLTNKCSTNRGFSEYLSVMLGGFQVYFIHQGASVDSRALSLNPLVGTWIDDEPSDPFWDHITWNQSSLPGDECWTTIFLPAGEYHVEYLALAAPECGIFRISLADEVIIQDDGFTGMAIKKTYHNNSFVVPKHATKRLSLKLIDYHPGVDDECQAIFYKITFQRKV
jgi:hypothetical protein